MELQMISREELWKAHSRAFTVDLNPKPLRPPPTLVCIRCTDECIQQPARDQFFSNFVLGWWSSKNSSGIRLLVNLALIVFPSWRAKNAKKKLQPIHNLLLISPPETLVSFNGISFQFPLMFNLVEKKLFRSFFESFCSIDHMEMIDFELKQKKSSRSLRKLLLAPLLLPGQWFAIDEMKDEGSKLQQQQKTWKAQSSQTKCKDNKF